jgi:predicted nuclease of predicted toxin-antitoxin system
LCILINSGIDKLATKLQDIFPGSTHVMLRNLDETPDEIIWEFAKASGFTIVTKDADYTETNLIKGFPPKVIWLRIGNCKIADLEMIIRKNHLIISEFCRDRSLGIIEISLVASRMG